MSSTATLLTLRVSDFDAVVRSAEETRLAARLAGVETEIPYPVARARCPDAAFFVPDKELAGRAICVMTTKAMEYFPPVEPLS